MTYEAFRDAIKLTLEQAEVPLTWTEIRTTAKLPQAFPNNQWVRRMEEDISLHRSRDSHGIIHWGLASGESIDTTDRTKTPKRASSRSASKEG